MKHTRKLAALLISFLALSALVGCHTGSEPPVETASPAVEDSMTAESARETTSVTDTDATETDLPETETVDPEDGEREANEARLRAILGGKTKLRFDENGKFKIMMLSDLHMTGTGLTAASLQNIQLLVEHEKPDLIILTGDNIADSSIWDEAGLRRVLKRLTDYLEGAGIYWIHVYGNHDGEMQLPLERQHRVYESYEHCLSKAGDMSLHGLGNYAIPLYGDDEEVKFLIWALDSGDYLSAEEKKILFPVGKMSFTGTSSPTYDYIHSDQIEWYVEASQFLQEQNGGEKIPGLMAFHIPLQETYDAWLNRGGLEWTGQKGGAVGASGYNPGFFEVIRRRGDIRAIVNGHDHANDYMVNYAGIKLCYTSTVTNPDEKIRGTRFFVINESNPADVQTYMTYIKDLK
jgi:3',5'-cyclic AMP phosphodiesterase CpdA